MARAAVFDSAGRKTTCLGFGAPEIARMMPAVAEHHDIVGGAFPVRLEGHRAAHDDLPRPAGGQVIARA